MPLTSNPVQDIMIRDVVTVPYNASLGKAADLMMENRIGCLVVIKDDKPVGILTESDFVRLVGNDYARSLSLIVDDVIEPKLITATPSTTVFKAFFQAFLISTIRPMPWLFGKTYGILFSCISLSSHNSDNISFYSGDI